VAWTPNPDTSLNSTTHRLAKTSQARTVSLPFQSCPSTRT
jgi:hypothetical protein